MHPKYKFKSYLAKKWNTTEQQPKKNHVYPMKLKTHEF